jgi:hypothetical protein
MLLATLMDVFVGFRPGQCRIGHREAEDLDVKALREV